MHLLTYRYDVIVVDEVHERHLSCDILLSLLKIILQTRNGHHQDSSSSSLLHRPLKLVLMSATLNAALFSDYFDKAPIIEVSSGGGVKWY
jgi:HrpA-like RNA helicase